MPLSTLFVRGGFILLTDKSSPRSMNTNKTAHRTIIASHAQYCIHHFHTRTGFDRSTNTQQYTFLQTHRWLHLLQRASTLPDRRRQSTGWLPSTRGNNAPKPDPAVDWRRKLTVMIVGTSSIDVMTVLIQQLIHCCDCDC